jgi:hypothetical protein
LLLAIRALVFYNTLRRAIMAGANETEFPILEAALRNESRISLSRAQELLGELRGTASPA